MNEFFEPDPQFHPDGTFDLFLGVFSRGQVLTVPIFPARRCGHDMGLAARPKPEAYLGHQTADKAAA